MAILAGPEQSYCHTPAGESLLPQWNAGELRVGAITLEGLEGVGDNV
jgi:hypothetical protein